MEVRIELEQARIVVTSLLQKKNEIHTMARKWQNRLNFQ